MDLKELAKALGMPEDSTAEAVSARIRELVAMMAEAKKEVGEVKKEAEVQTAALATALSSHGLKLDAGKLVKVDPIAAGPQPGDSAETKQLREEIAKARLLNGRTQLSAVKDLVKKYVGDDKLIPPAAQEALTRLMSVGDRVEAMSLSADGQSIERAAFSHLDDLKSVLDSIVPVLSGGGLSRIKPDSVEGKQKAEALSHAQHVARRATGRKEPAAAAK
jgi:hypothetical protein